MNESNKSMCSCTDKSVLVLDLKQSSRYSALAVICLLCMFTGGYFLGKKNALSEINDALALNIASSIDPATCSAINNFAPQHITTIADVTDQPPKPVDFAESTTMVPAINQQSTEISPDCYIARLIGFGSHKAAQQFVAKLKKFGIDTTLIKRTANGTVNNANRVITWYQVITQPHANKEKLEQLIDQIQKVVTIKDIQIAKVDNNGYARKNTEK